MYCFDPTFGTSSPGLLGAYCVPECVGDDLFDLVGAGVERPDYRWLLVGGPRTGQTWHTDPNSTSAWNLTLRGRKRWLFFPPGATPPGVLPTSDGDGDNYLAPVGVDAWARAGFYEDAARRDDFYECDAGPGDVVFVPRNWWHMVVNTGADGATVAVSHHFCSPAGLPAVLRRLRETPEQVSGVDRMLAADRHDGGGGGRAAKRRRVADDLAKRRAAGEGLLGALVAAVAASRPAVLAAAEATLAAEDEKRKPRATAWSALAAPAERGFAFNFA